MRIANPSINGTQLAAMGFSPTAAGATVAAPTASMTLQTVPGRMGSVDTSLCDELEAVYLGSRTVTLEVYAIGTDHDIRAMKTRLATLVGQQVRLSWDDLGGSWLGRLGLSEWSDLSVGRGRTATVVTISMDADPLLVGDQHTVALGATTTIVTDGNRPCWPSLNLIPASNTKTVTVQDAHGHQLTITAPSAITGTISVDTHPDSRRIRINGQLAVPTIDSDYFPLIPGSNRLALTGATGTLTWQPLTLI